MRTTFRDLCISALKISRAVDAEETPNDNEIASALDQLNSFLEQMHMDRLFSIAKKTTTITTIGGTVYFSKTAVPSGANVGECANRILSVIDLNRSLELQEIAVEDFALKDQLGAQHGYFATREENPNQTALYVSSGSKPLKITYEPRFEGVGLDGVFEAYYPKYNWGVVEYGLAVFLGHMYGQDISANSAIYQSRLSRLQNYNAKPIMLANGTHGTFENGWF